MKRPAAHSAPDSEIPSVKKVAYWEKVEDFEHGMDTNDNFLGWLKLVGSSKAWHIEDNGNIVSI